jgi:AhpD family alkylhydroperoxidase
VHEPGHFFSSAVSHAGAQARQDVEEPEMGSPSVRGNGKGRVMSKPIDAREIAPDALKALYGVEQYVRGSGLEHSLLLLVKLRASFMNGCAYCVDMHSKDARAEGETEQRVYSVPVWRETPYYSARERAALAWAEAVTAIGEHGVTDALRNQTREHFSERELVDLTMAVIAINAWNRLAISMAAVPGSYERSTR